MGLGRIKHTVTKAGEWLHDTTFTYWGGSPLAINHSGTLQLAKYAQLASTKSDATSTSYVGVSYNTSAENAKTYKGQTTFIVGSCVLTLSKMSANVDNSVLNVQGTAGQLEDDYPYDTTLTWNEADLVFVGIDGLWVNANPASGDPCYGTVLEVGTNYLTVLFYNVPCAVY